MKQVPAEQLSRDAWHSLPRTQLRAVQLQRLNQLLRAILPSNRFYARKLAAVSLPVQDLDELQAWPLTTKEELSQVALESPEDLRTFPDSAYARVHRTSGTTGQPLYVLDTPNDWEWWIATWQFVLDSADASPGDRALMAFSFGPFIGFWSAFDALVRRGCQVVPAGGMSTLNRLRMLFEVQAQLLFCTPTYALHLAEVAREQALSLRDSSVRSIVVAGEPGGSVPGVRRQIEDAWGARIVDHAGATEVGPWGLADRAGHGLHVIEAEFLAEWLPWSPSDGVHVLPPASGRSDVPPPTHELVITALGRYGMPAIRYRTGDLAAPQADLLTDSVTPANAQEPCGFVFLPGGILGRVDEMLTVRGVNVFPQAIDAILRRYAPWAEYRIVLQRHQALDQLLIQVEAQPATAAELALALSSELGLRLHVESLASGSLPRFEGKARRVIDQRSSA